MDIRQLANFVQIIDVGSLTRAATVIGVAQPALTFQIAKLEKELGCQLLIRSTRGVHPTEAGMLLYREAQAILRKVQQIPQLLHRPATDPTGDVTIGFPNSLAPFLSTSVLAVVQTRFPRIRLHIFEGESTLQREQILKNRVELALICEHEPNADIFHRPLFRQRLALLCDSRSAEHDGKPIDLAEAAAHIVGLPSAGNPVRLAFDEAIRGLGLSVDVRLEFNTIRTLTDAVERGFGASINLWMPNEGNGWANVVFRPIVNPELWLHVSLCRSKVNQPTPAAMLVEDIMAEVTTARVNQPDWVGSISQHDG